MAEKSIRKLEVGRYYELYDGWSSWKGEAKYLGSKKCFGSQQHLFVFGEDDKKRYILLDAFDAVKEEIITHFKVAAHGLSILSRQDIKTGDSGLLVALNELGEKI